jgi:uncharacterized protein (DUF779 family)
VLDAGQVRVQVEALGGMPVYIDAEQDERWNRPCFVLDVAAGPASGFSLEGSTASTPSRGPDPGAPGPPSGARSGP